MKIIEYIHKGENCLTEMYSAIEAEVPIPTDPNTQTNTGLIAKLKLASKLLICGQAKSHTVNYTTKVMGMSCTHVVCCLLLNIYLICRRNNPILISHTVNYSTKVI